MVKVKEIFASIQGEGPYVGYKQLFIRFCGCNLNCGYCDTEFDSKDAVEYSVENILKIIDNNLTCHSVSLTGGEPLLNVEFLKDFLPQCKLPVYLETNGTLYKNLEDVIDDVTYVSADIKLPSCTGLDELWEEHDKFFAIASQKKLFAKAVFDYNITENEIVRITNLCKKYDIELILQPRMDGEKLLTDSNFISKVLDGCLVYHPKTRLIPQVHKFLDVE